ncbi:MAG: long-chain fatty acid--CoA ligase [Mollicutes bacterium]|nr:long-chain fatty acid--CoA ligase [Mollicutes bacterium]
MLEKLFLKLKNLYRRIDMKINRRKYGYLDKLPKNIKYFKGSLYDAIYDASCKWPHNVAIEYYDRQFTYREFIKETDKVARCLRGLGVEKGDYITVCMPNTPEATMFFYAINQVGAIANMIHPLSSEKEIEYYLNKTKSKVMLCIDITYPKLKEIIDNTKVEKVIIASATRSMEKIVQFIYWLKKGRKLKVKEDTRVILWKTFEKYEKKFVGNPRVIVDADDPAVILYSGGTTGTPKGVVLTNMNLNAEALQAAYAVSFLVPENSILTFLPNFHCFGLAVSTHIPLNYGMRVILIPQFNIKKLKHYMRKYRFNIMCGVPTIYDYITKMKWKKNELKDFKIALVGGDAISTELKELTNETLKKYGSPAKLQIGYGLTEASSVVSYSPIEEKNAEIIGYALPNCDFLVKDLNADAEAPLGESGEILVSGPVLMKEYLDDEKETKNAFIELNGKKWLRTGDVGFLDKKGLMHYQSRLKRMIITSGYNVYPSQVEKVIMSSEVVDKCAVIGVPDKNKGEIVKAFIVLKEGINSIIARTKIQKVLKENLARFEQPREFKYVDSLPITKLGKIAYKELENIK